ncbi:MAG: Peptidase M23 [candidate division TM6 bacterium GW2011_GWE2_31_21]|nr:MAG: Peptidase M23 [candidate division TM6 bacterium GW2011_GWE2_31_21]KKP53157.1 MAG: Peptidase M23 [candidate division TM6 bacterium GW2011_GWF2_33_332]
MKNSGSLITKCFLILCCTLQISYLKAFHSHRSHKKHSTITKKISKTTKHRKLKVRSLRKKYSARKTSLKSKANPNDLLILNKHAVSDISLKTPNTSSNIQPLENQQNQALNSITIKNPAKITFSRFAEYLKRKQIFNWPLKGRYYISSPFGSMRARGRVHAGIDLAAPKWTPVFASARGEVEIAAKANAYGNMVLIKHNKNFKSRYAHLHKILVKPGAVVKKGDLIAYVGNTGFVMGRNGDHLHFEVLFKNHPVNPIKILS